MAFTYVTVTHTFEVANDVPASGVVEFTPVAPMRNEISVVAASVKATLTVAGLMSQTLAANTDPGTTPTGTTYKVTERFTGQPALTYYIQVPHDQGATIDLRALAGWVGGGGGGGSGTVTSVNGEDPDLSGNVVLSASDVGAQPASDALTRLAAGAVPLSAVSGTITPNAALGYGPHRHIATTDVTLADPTGGVDGQPIEVQVLASGATRTLTAAGASITIPAGSWWWGHFSYVASSSTWLLDDSGGGSGGSGGAAYTDEQVRDVIGAALVAGANVTITPNDAGDTITIAAATSGSSGIPASLVDAKGDLIAATANDTVARLPVGVDGQALVANSGSPAGLTWAVPTPASHTHATTDITSGTIATARLGSGTASASTFLRGDQTWATGATYTDEQAQDATAALFAAGTHSGITFTYNDASNTISATVTSAEGATYTGNKTINGRFGVNATTSVRQPINMGATIAGGSISGSTDDKVGIELAPKFTGNFTGTGGSNPGFAWGLNLFATTGSAAGDGAGLTDVVGALLEMSLGTPAGTTFNVVRGLQAEAAFFGSSSGCTVTQMESMRVSAPKRKDGATAGTATTAYCLFVEDPTAYSVGASNSWALFVEGGTSRFQGRVDIDGTLVSYNGSLSLQGDYSGAGKIQLTTNNIGFFGVTPVARQTLPASGSVTAANIRQALINLGLCV